MTVADHLHVLGVNFILILQSVFKGHDELMLFLSHLGDPHKSFIIYFPVAYCLHSSVGIRLVWVAAISEWLNAILKWFFYGDRPYWWVNETGLYDPDNRPHLEQYSLTCETGPGSPSGHAMVSSSTMFVLASALIFYKLPNDRLKSSLVWAAFSIHLLLISISRCFIATHFPHQVIMGTFNGCLLAYLCNKVSMHALTWRSYLSATVIMLVSGTSLFYLFEWLGMEPLWSVAKAMKWCADKSWIRQETSLFYALMRDSACLLGLGLSSECVTLYPRLSMSHNSLPVKLLNIVTSIIFISFLDHIPLPKHPSSMFYPMAFVKFLILPFIVVVFVPFLVSLFGKRTESPEKRH